MMKKLKLTVLAFAIVLVSSCKENKNKVEKNEEVIEEVEVVESKILVAPLSDSPAYADAKLMLNTPQTMTIAEVGKVDFDFTLENYNLEDQTDSPNAQRLANSGKGQHIHFILNNQPYSAHYEPNIKKEIPVGVHHLVAFLSRSYHESVKNENSVVVRKLVVGDNPEDKLSLDMDAPTLIYSRPKGTYVGKDADYLMLDFFVLNTKLSEKGNKVRATINSQEILITKWEPYIIKGLPKGEVNIKLELIDAEGNVIPGPFNTVERTVTLKAEEAVTE